MDMHISTLGELKKIAFNSDLIPCPQWFLYLIPRELNPVRAKWPVEPVLISHFCSVLKVNESLTSPGQNTNPSQVSSQQMQVLIHLPRKDGKLS